jgi:hypothetical protein
VTAVVTRLGGLGLPWVILAAIGVGCLILAAWQTWLLPRSLLGRTRPRPNSGVREATPVQREPHSLAGGGLGGATGSCVTSERAIILRYQGPHKVVECVVGREGDPVAWTWKVPGTDHFKGSTAVLDTVYPSHFPGAPPQYVPGDYFFSWRADMGNGQVQEVASGKWRMPAR